MDYIVAVIIGAWAIASLAKEFVGVKAPQETEGSDIVWNEAISRRIQARG